MVFQEHFKAFSNSYSILSMVRINTIPAVIGIDDISQIESSIVFLKYLIQLHPIGANNYYRLQVITKEG